ncbi:hypothetical protein [Polymorphobacter sp.]|uniref:hypothetical protein n=1 Tax=Polymorphobacter sp. TaxID=1909290 RepID=UPI003F71C6EF
MLQIAGAICLAVSHPSVPYDGEPPRLRAALPSLPASAVSAAAFAPPGWDVEIAVEGDLNGDGQPDLAAVLKGADPDCIVEVEGVTTPMDTNPRLLLVAFRRKTGFDLQAANVAVIPRADDPYMDDPLDAEALAIRRGILSLGLIYWRSMGGWTSYSSVLSFRWNGKQMRLIGFDRETLQRNSGQTETLSVNFVSRRASLANGSIEEDPDRLKRWQRIPVQEPQALETIGDGLAYLPKLQASKQR